MHPHILELVAAVLWHADDRQQLRFAGWPLTEFSALSTTTAAHYRGKAAELLEASPELERLALRLLAAAR